MGSTLKKKKQQLAVDHSLRIKRLTDFCLSYAIESLASEPVIGIKQNYIKQNNKK